MTTSPARGVAQRLADLRARGRNALSTPPDAEEWQRTPDDERRRILDDLRVDLYALTAVLAYAAVGRAVGDRPAFPPYGLARSKFTDFGLVTTEPEAYERGSIDSFFTLWQAFVDTMVMHLHRELDQRRQSAMAWTVDDLERLLPLFASVDRPDKEARKRDAITFVYGGLQFGTSVCVQLAEVGARTLRRDAPQLDAAEQAAVLDRSTGPAYRLAALDFDRALAIYRRLLSQDDDTPEQGRSKPGWLDAGRFTVRQPREGPWRVALTGVEDPSDDESTGVAATRLGCPARIAADGEETPIGHLWRWCVEVAADTELLG